MVETLGYISVQCVDMTPGEKHCCACCSKCCGCCCPCCPCCKDNKDAAYNMYHIVLPADARVKDLLKEMKKTTGNSNDTCYCGVTTLNRDDPLLPILKAYEHFKVPILSCGDVIWTLAGEDNDDDDDKPRACNVA